MDGLLSPKPSFQAPQKGFCSNSQISSSASKCHKAFTCNNSGHGIMKMDAKPKTPRLLSYTCTLGTKSFGNWTKSPWSLWLLGSQFLQQFQWETELKNPQEVLFQTSEICWRFRVVAYQNKNNFHVGFRVVESPKYHFDLNISDIFHTGCHSWRKK